jgi:CheY-like chemotaxis protein
MDKRHWIQLLPILRLILLDVMMPDMDGFEVCRRFKDSPSTTHIPVIFITAKNAVEDEERGFALGAAVSFTSRSALLSFLLV